MKDILKVISILMQLLPYIKEIIEFLSGLLEIKKQSGAEVVKQIAQDSAQISSNWKQYLIQRNQTDTSKPFINSEK